MERGMVAMNLCAYLLHYLWHFGFELPPLALFLFQLKTRSFDYKKTVAGLVEFEGSRFGSLMDRIGDPAICSNMKFTRVE
eukprot:271496-Amorphochlora_amoeboformis.AAC.1